MSAVAIQSFFGVAGRNEDFSLSPTSAAPAFINARDGNDYVSTSANDDIIYGGLGVDILVGRAGNDTIYGDQYWNDETTSANQNLAAAADLILGDAFFGEAPGGPDTIFAGGGKNYVNGEQGDDYILGGSGHEFLQGGSGNDTVFGLGGNDVIIGGTATNANQTAFIDANLGTNISYNFNGLTDGALNSSITPRLASGEVALTNTGNDYLNGGDGNDRINGQDGADTLLGESGADMLDGGAGADILIGGDGVDTANYTNSGGGISINLTNMAGQYNDAQGDLLYGIENVYGSAAPDLLRGDAFPNLLVGASGGDILIGEGGNDALSGGTENDILMGDSGEDAFIFRQGDGGDLVTDFDLNGNDVILFADFGPGFDLGDLAFTATASGTVVTGNGWAGSIFLQNTPIAIIGVDDFVFV